MRDRFIAEVKEHDSVDNVFLVKSKALSVGKTGKPYLVITLMDKTGELEGRVWDDAEEISSAFEADDFIRAKGRVSAYMGKLQVKVSGIVRVDEDSVELEDFLPCSERDPDEMFGELAGIIDSVKDGYIKKLLSLLMDDPAIARGFRRAPAAKGMHHVYIGGLLEHVLSICRLIDFVATHYGNGIKRDLLIAGAILHDMGKTRELSYARSFGYTDEGRLLGHITIGVEMMDEKMKTIDGFPAETALLLKHMILSHHGEYAYGSPKRPKTLEATILSYLDDLDAKVNSIRSLIANESGNGSNWTGFHRLFERFIYKGCEPEFNELKNEELKKEGKKEAAAGRPLPLFGNQA